MWHEKLELLIDDFVKRIYDGLTTSPGWPIALFVLLSMMADAILVKPVGGGDPLTLVVLALYLSQVTLAAIWLALGRSPFSVRIVLAVFAWLAWACVTSHRDRGLWVMTALVTAALAVAFLAFRVLGLRLVRVGENHPWPDAASGRQRWQYSIGQMLGLTTAVAIILGTMKSLGFPFYGPRNIEYAAAVAFIVGQGLLAWGALSATLGTRRGLLLRAVVVVLAAALAVPTLGAASGGVANDLFLLSSISGLETVLLLASLWVFRLLGYRVVFRGGTIPEPPAHPDRRRRWTQIVGRIRAWRLEPRWVIGLALLATVEADALAIAASDRELGPDEPISVVVLALFLSQISLTAIWVAMGRSAFPVRAMLGFLVLVGWAAILVFAYGPADKGGEWYSMKRWHWEFPLAGRFSQRSVTDLLLFAADILAAVAVPLLVARVLGLRIAGRRPDGTLDVGPTGRRQFQFSILYMFGLTTATALVLGTVKWVLASYPLDYRMVDPDVVVFALGLGIIAWAALAATLRRWSVGAPAAGAMAMGVAAAVISVGLLAGKDSEYVRANSNLGLLLFLNGAMVLGWLLVIRLAGYRLVPCWDSRIGDGSVRKAAPRPRPAAAISLVCPHCRGSVSVPAEYCGQTGHCPLCGGTVSVPPMT